MGVRTRVKTTALRSACLITQTPARQFHRQWQIEPHKNLYRIREERAPGTAPPRGRTLQPTFFFCSLLSGRSSRLRFSLSAAFIVASSDSAWDSPCAAGVPVFLATLLTPWTRAPGTDSSSKTRSGPQPVPPAVRVQCADAFQPYDCLRCRVRLSVASVCCVTNFVITGVDR